MSKWQDRVERWNQLDEAARALCESYWSKREIIGRHPDWLLLASPGASNWTDAQFYNREVPSPSLFVHTLPNVRGAALLQVMQWHGPVLCIQKDPDTVATALNEGRRLAESENVRVWVATVTRVEGAWRAEFYVAEGSEITKI